MNDNRFPLSGREYHALRALFGNVSAFASCADELTKRTKAVPGAYRDMKCIMALSDKLLDSVLSTVPAKKLGMIRRDLKNVKVEVKVGRDFTGQKPDGYCYVPETPLTRLMDSVMSNECLLCDKQGAEAKKCQFRKDLDALMPWDLPVKGDACPFQTLIWNPEGGDDE